MSTNRDAIGNLGINQTEVLARFLLHHMSPEVRRKLMAQLPTIYAAAFPSADPQIILGKVSEAIEAERQA